MSTASIQPCYTETLVPSAVSNGLLSICTASIVAMSALKMHRNRKSLSAGPYRAQLVFYVICFLHCVCNAPYIVSNCHGIGGLWGQTILRFGRYSAYIFHWVSLCAVLFFRLRKAFASTAMAIPKCYSYLSLMILILMTALFLFNYIALIRQAVSLQNLSRLTAVMVITLATYSQFLTFTFVKKLFVLNRMTDKDRDLINTMTRLTVLAVVTMSVSLISIAVTILFGSGRVGADSIEWAVFGVRTAQSVDVLIDVICLSLGLNMFEALYYKVCGCADAKCKACCSSVTEASKVEVEMAGAMEVGPTPSSTASPEVPTQPKKMTMVIH